MKDITDNIFIQHLSLGVVCVDTSCRITFFNKWLEKYAGLKQNDVAGQSIFQVFPEIHHRGKDHYLKDCVEKNRSAILSPLVHHYFMDLTFIKGERRVQMIQEVKIFPLRKADECLGAIVIIRDFTEQIEHESSLVEKTRTLNALRNLNRMMVRVDTREVLFLQSVNILARDMGLPLVWFAHVQVQEGGGDVVIGDYDGMDREQFKSFLSDHSGDPRFLLSSLALTRRAMKTGTLQVTYRRDQSPEMGRWWDLFQAGSCNVAIAVPLCVEGRVMAVLHIHILENRRLSKGRLDLFQELADDIALPLKNFHDVGVRHEAELKTQAKKERLLVTLKGIADAVLVTDAHGKVILMNPVAETLTGWREEEAVGKAASTVFSILNEISRNPYTSPVDQVIATGKVVAFTNHTLLISRSGREYPITSSAAPVENGNGDPMGVVLIFRDVTQCRKFEKALRISEKWFRDITMTMGELVWEFDTNGIFTYMCSAVEQVLGYEHREFLGRPFWEFTFLEQVDGDQDMDLQAAFLKYKVEKRSFSNLETRALDKVWQWRLLLTNGIPLINEAGTLVGYRGVTRDITEQKKLENEKEMAEYHFHQAQRMESIGTLAGGIAHDFNNILSAIIGYTELSLDDIKKGSILHESLMTVITAGHRARDMVKLILPFARKSDETKNLLQPGVIAKEVLKFIRSSLPTTIDIRQNIQSEALIMGSDIQMHQVLMNLCTNAAQAMDAKGGVLEMTVCDVVLDDDTIPTEEGLFSGDYLQIRVSDTGAGISPDTIESIFDPYFTTRGSGSGSGSGSGTGMGLALVHGIVNRCGGHVSVESTLGQGAVFTVLLPVIKKQKVSPSPQARNEDVLPRGSERVLYVDDEASIIKIGERYLKRLGYEVVTSISSGVALEMFRATPHDFDLIITDMAMPGMTGDVMALKMMKIRPDVPVILCTGYSSQINRKKAIKSDIRGFINKPIVRKELAETVRRVLDGHN